MKNFIQEGDVVTVPAPYDVASGAGCLVGSLFGVAASTALSGANVEIAVEGVFELKKTSAQAWAVGDRIYWDNSAKECTTAAAAGANKLVGVALAVAANPTAAGIVRLSSAFTL